jgi:hypothetical protein
MKNTIPLFVLLIALKHSSAQTDTLKRADAADKKTTIFNSYPPHLNPLNNAVVLRNQEAPIGRKLLRASAFTLTADALSFGVLYISPKTFSKWNLKKKDDFKTNYTIAFTQPPIIDKDHWYVNYLGHPYQGAYTYNALRSQGGTMFQSSLFVVVSSTMWEYACEGGEERPSIQDLIVTPIGGAILGELCHRATVKMSKNGFKWYEIVFVSFFNPSYVFNNGFKFAKPKGR